MYIEEHTHSDEEVHYRFTNHINGVTIDKEDSRIRATPIFEEQTHLFFTDERILIVVKYGADKLVEDINYEEIVEFDIGMTATGRSKWLFETTNCRYSIPVRTYLDESCPDSVAFLIDKITEEKQNSWITQNREYWEEKVKKEDSSLLEEIVSIFSTDPPTGGGKHITETPNIDFSDVGGMDELKRKLEKEIIEPIQNPDKFEEYNVRNTNGFLFYGPPGTGKTYISKALAGEMGFNYIKLEPNDIRSKYFGQSTSRVSDVFDTARENEPCIVFMDELDAIAGQRKENIGSGSDASNKIVNQLLNEISELNESDDRVTVIGATNRVDAVDDAIKRSGRFDKKIEVPPPDKEARKKILKIHLTDRPKDEVHINYAQIASETEGYVSSDIERIAEKAALEAAHEGQSISAKHLRQAIEDTESSMIS